MKIKTYQRGGNKNCQRLIQLAAEYFCQRMMTDEECDGMEVKVKLVHSPKAIKVQNGGFADSRLDNKTIIENKGEDKVDGIETPFYKASLLDLSEPFVIAVRNAPANGSRRSGADYWNGTSMAKMVDSLGHELAHVMQYRRGTLRTFVSMTYLMGVQQPDGSIESKHPQHHDTFAQWTGPDGEVEVRDVEDWPYESRPWEVEARAMGRLLSDEWLRLTEMAKRPLMDKYWEIYYMPPMWDRNRFLNRMKQIHFRKHKNCPGLHRFMVDEYNDLVFEAYEKTVEGVLSGEVDFDRPILG